MKTKTLSLIALLLVGTCINSFAQRGGRGGERGGRAQAARTVRSHVQTGVSRINPSMSHVTYRGTPRISVQRALPNGGATLRLRNRNYYYNDGRFYAYNNRRYICVAPPIGLRIGALPFGFLEIAGAASLFYYYGGTFYIQDNNEYVVADPPVGAIVYDLPVEADKVQIDGKTYFQYNGILYKRVNTENGRGFQVVGKLAEEQSDTGQ